MFEKPMNRIALIAASVIALSLAAAGVLAQDYELEPQEKVKPIIVSPKAVTQKQVEKQYLKVYQRIVVQAYKDYGKHDARWDEQALKFLNAYARAAAVPQGTMPSEALAKLGKAAMDAGCADPLVQSCYGIVLAAQRDNQEAHDLMVAAQPGLESGKYPKIRARTNQSHILAVRFQMGKLQDPDTKDLYKNLVKLTVQCLTDGSFKPGEARAALPMLLNDMQGIWEENSAPIMDAALEDVKGADPYVLNVLLGHVETTLAWRARSTGWADQVSEAGWQGFEEHLGRARNYLVKAWKSHPENPIAPNLMITVATGSSDGSTGSPRIWFDRAVSAQIDYIPAYQTLMWAWLPRWEGSHEMMYRLGVECLKTGRFDTQVPWQFVAALQNITADADNSPAYWTRPSTFGRLKTLFDGYDKVAKSKAERNKLMSQRAALYWYAGRYGEARQALQALGSSLDTGAYESLINTNAGSAISETYALGGPNAQVIRRANSLADAGKDAQAIPLYQKALQADSGNTRGLSYLKSRLAAAENRVGFAKGDWVDVTPDKDFNGWKTYNGDWSVSPDGAVSAVPTSSKKSPQATFDADLGTRLEVKVDLEFGDGPSQYYSGGVVVGLPFQNDDESHAEVMVMRNEKMVDLISIPAWYNTTKRDLDIPAKCSLDVLYWDKQYEVILDGISLLKGTVKPSDRETPTAPGKSDTPHRIALTTGLWWDKTPMIFRHVQVRRLTEKPEGM